MLYTKKSLEQTIKRCFRHYYTKSQNQKQRSLTHEIYVPCVFRKNEDGTYNGYFPDLECCTSTGDTLDEAIENANEAAYNWITVELDEEEPNLPSISDPSDLDLTPEDIVRIISVNIRFYEGWDE